MNDDKNNNNNRIVARSLASPDQVDDCELANAFVCSKL